MAWGKRYYRTLWLVALLGVPSWLMASEPVAMVMPNEIVVTQDPPKVVPRVLDKSKPDNTSLQVSLARQRAYLMVDGEVAIDTPISSGKRRGLTPAGEYSITAKSTTHQTNLHGDFVDHEGRILRAGVSTRIDSAPSGAIFRVKPVEYFMRLTPEGLALYAAAVPGYPAADTAVRLPVDIAPLIYQRVKVGTPVKIED